VTNGMADNTNTASSADTSSVTAIKVKVVLDTTTEELKNQFKGVQNSFKKAPVEIAFGVNEGATIGNVNAALKRIIKKVESPKLTLKIDESNIDAAIQKASKKAQNGASKGSGTTVKVGADTKEATQKLNAFYSRVKEIGKVRAEIQDGLSNGALSKDLQQSYVYLQSLREEAKRLQKELGSAIPTGEYSKVNEISRKSPNRNRNDATDLDKLRERVTADYNAGYDSNVSRLITRLQESAKLSKDALNLSAKDWSSGELTEVLNQLESIDDEVARLKESLGDAIPADAKSKIEELERTATNGLNRVQAKLLDLNEKTLQTNLDRISEDEKKQLETREKTIESFQKKIQEFENNSKNDRYRSIPSVQEYVGGKDGESGKLAEMKAALQNIQDSKASATIEDFDNKCKSLNNTLAESSQHIKELGIESGKNVDEKQLKSIYLRAQKLEDSIPNLSKYPDIANELARIKQASLDGSEGVTKLDADLTKLEVTAEKTGATTESLGGKLSRLFKEHFQTAIAMAGVAMVKQGLREVYDNVLELDTAVTELKKVSKMTGDEMNEYLDRTATNARELGANISDLVSSTADWKRLGYTDKDSEELARVSALMANVGDQIENATTASSYLISAMQGFGLVADDAERLLDCMNQIANTEPVSMNDLGIIMQKSSAAMSAAGNTYQETLSLAAAVNGVLQDADTSGTYLKTLSMYLRASKTDAENAGIATDGMADSVSELRSELKQLAGVDIMKDDNTFKSTYQIMKELSEVWKDLSDTTQANITELISGKRGGQSTSALLNNFSVAEDAMKQALNSSGSAMRENETYMQSLQAKLNQLDSAFQKFSTDLMKSDIPKFFVDLATVFVDGADNAVKFAGTLPTLTAAISGVLSVIQMSGKLKNGAGKVNMPSYICCV
jgi:TP901 family phage tail tape measure protein